MVEEVVVHGSLWEVVVLVATVVVHVLSRTSFRRCSGSHEDLGVHGVFAVRRYLTSKWSLGYLAFVLPGCSATEVVHGPRIVDHSGADLRSCRHEGVLGKSA